ncbi:beta barrel domain-containing protein [Clostridium tagluense]|uniref:Uncharacterized protein n=1 Tax=Clostridium tagluense TaxID=360422 RepID=A0A401UTL7_9CLOT|nr:hypothetical protein [Clostridium tagluense]GCD12902.1 hypothetical protein Ctaglu_45250 [Clostridium tagluense]
MELKVGIEVFLKPIDSNAKGKDAIMNYIREGYIVSKIGSKYIYAWDGRNKTSELQFHKDTRKENNWNADWQLFFSRQEILDDIEYNESLRKLRNTFGSYGTIDLSVEKVKRIMKIVEED